MSPFSTPPVVAIVGAGPAGLFAAEHLSGYGCHVEIFEQMPSVGRKLLMAGRSGLNLTHSEPLDLFITRYGPAQDWLTPALLNFPPDALRRWAESLGQECFSGSSGRVFPKSMKASPLLRAWLSRLAEQGVQIRTRHRFTGWEGSRLTFESPSGPVTFAADATLMATGGASWSRLGSDGRWAGLFPAETSPFKPSNCGFMPSWPDDVLQRHDGEVLHSVGLSFQGTETRGDLTITPRGLEGSALYALSASLRDAITSTGTATLSLDLRPTLSEDAILKRLQNQRPRESQSNRLRKALSLDGASRELLRQATPKQATPLHLARAIKALPIVLTGTDTLDRAISTAGGLRQDALDEKFMVKAHPGVFAAGEMLDWEAPTGGYLLQGCFSTGLAAAKGVLGWLESSVSGIR
ncbi:TIGR03862 family flavoprotein [Gluconobacter cerinus]|uniref:TIGR03862 family flavoprotein n=1 Tax=Gluconobacter cerinus TaxID=38307 RepID=UPI001B8D9C2C|nr:TIGR03862 family flavoprotein [Gluconobacter cerinus]MBS1039650.1 TIGR03862 family flavoprotein [Gluconobacter cerinus]MBS1046175.1 TIGR03862 family flavoprotein [Gluconobacter cerinus]